MKKFLSVFLALIILITPISTSLAFAESSITLIINNEEHVPNEEIIVEDEKMMIPLREISELLGFEVTWDGEQRSIDLKKDSSHSKVQLNSKKSTYNGTEYNLMLAPELKGDITYVPIEFFGNYMSLTTHWDSNSKSLSISSTRENPEDFFSPLVDTLVSNKLDSFMKEYMKRQNFQGTVLIADDDQIILNQGYGHNNIQYNILNSSQTKFAIGSITKQFVALGIMQLEEDGKLNVDDTIDKYISGLKYGKDITVHQLLIHSSGLYNVTNDLTFFGLQDASPEQVIDLIRERELNFTPGSEYEYSNTNYILLGMIIEKITDESLEEYLTDNIFEPLNMKDTGISYGENAGFAIATPYQGYIDVFEVDDKPLLAHAYGAGNMYSTVEDLYRWSQALDTDKLVSKETKDKIFKGHMDLSHDIGYGYGWIVSDTDEGKILMHDGATLGFSSIIFKDTYNDVSIIALTNRRLQDVYGIQTGLESILSGDDFDLNNIPEKPTEIKVDPSEYDKYLGRYMGIEPTTNTDLIIDVVKDSDKLYLRMEGSEDVEIFPEADNRFFTKIAEMTIEFILNEEGETTKLILVNPLGIPIEADNEKFVQSIEEIQVSEDVLDRYVGEYELMEGFILTVARDGSVLSAQATGQDSFELFATSENNFRYRSIAATIEFLTDENGQVNEILFKQMGQEIIGKRIK